MAKLNAIRVAAFLLVAPLVLLVGQSALGCGGYVKQASEGGTYTDTNVSQPGSFDMKVESYTASWTSSSVDCALRVFDNIPLNSDSNTGGGKANGWQKQWWKWNGAPGSAPGATFDVHFDGDGDVSATGTAICGFAIGGSASSSSNGSSLGNGSGSNCRKQPSASINSVGGSCTHNTNGSLGGSTSASPQGGGVSASLGAGNTGVGSYARTGQWSIDLSTRGDTNGSTFYVKTKHKCIAATAATANGSLIGPATGYCHVEAEAAMNANVSNILEK